MIRIINFSGFFDYKDPNYVSEMFSIQHFIYIFISIILLITLPILLRKVSHKKIDKYLKFLSIFIPCLELTKIIWESIYYFQETKSFMFESLLPLYLCSLFIYVLPIIVLNKKKPRKYCLSFLTTIGIIAGLSNVFYLNILNVYPLFSFASFISIIFHFLMAFTGIWLLTSKYYILDKKSPLEGLLIVFLFSLIVIPVNYLLNYLGYNPDYMLLLHGYGIPFFPEISNFLRSYHLDIIFIILVFLVYLGIGYLVFFVNNLIKKIILYKEKNKSN